MCSRYAASTSRLLPRTTKAARSAAFGGGGRVEWKYFFEDERWKDYTARAARQAIVNLDAVDAPAGEMVVVLGPGWPGILLHEAIGHGLEGDFNRKGVSAFSGRIGQRRRKPTLHRDRRRHYRESSRQPQC